MCSTTSRRRRCSARVRSDSGVCGSPGDAATLGLYGFGAAAHLAIQVARHRGQRVFAFTRPGDLDAQRFARELGAEWAGPSDTAPPEPLDAAILFAPVGALVPAALRAVDKGGAVICGGIT
jgi:propanol-preferring alcohol dehydrogenase